MSHAAEADVLTKAIPARLVKALTLADYLDGAGIRSRRAELMDTPQWSLLAGAAAVRLPSGETRALTISLLRAREDVRKRLACLRRRRVVLAAQETV